MTELTAQHSEPAISAKQEKTPEELAAMIHHDLSQIEGCPQRGIKVTVYGLNAQAASQRAPDTRNLGAGLAFSFMKHRLSGFGEVE
jgi:hypothetical protein